MDERGSGGTDKISVPEFSGEDDRDGGKAKSYLRKVQAWRRVTRLKPHKQALVLYNALTGKAWRDAEEIDLTLLDTNDGVDNFLKWVTERYLDKEIVKAGKYMSEFFKHYKRGPSQDIRDFNMEFDRHVNKLKEVGCVLPGVCCAWWYIDKLRMDNAAELSLLSSVGNQYELPRLQEAAVVQDRMNRRLWEHRKIDGKKNQVFCTELEEGTEYDDDQEDAELFDGDVAFQNAKAKQVQQHVEGSWDGDVSEP